MSTLTATLPPNAIDQNLHCNRCGYNLRTLATDARCPECSAPISSSLDPTLLRYADPVWTHGLVTALGLMIFSASVQAAYALVVLLLLRTQAFWAFGLGTLFGKSYQFVAPLFWLGVYLLGSPGQPPASPPRRFSLRRTMCIAALLNLVWAILPEMKMITLPIEQLLDLVATVLLFLYLLQIARRSQRPGLIRHTCIAMALVILADFAIITVDVFVDSDSPKATFTTMAYIPIFAYQVFVLSLFRRTLRQCASFARQYWHFCMPIATNSEAAQS